MIPITPAAAKTIRTVYNADGLLAGSGRQDGLIGTYIM
jgi:hypothetical protein